MTAHRLDLEIERRQPLAHRGRNVAGELGPDLLDDAEPDDRIDLELAGEHGLGDREQLGSACGARRLRAKQCGDEHDRHALGRRTGLRKAARAEPAIELVEQCERALRSPSRATTRDRPRSASGPVSSNAISAV